MKQVQQTLFFLILGVALLATGCGTWDKSQEIYETYIDRDPAIDLDDDGVSDPTKKKMARLFTPVDAQLHGLTKTMEVQDTFPDEGWEAAVLNQYPWLNGVAAVRSEGQVLFQEPEYFIKPVNYDILLNSDEPEKALRARVDKTSFGPEVYIGSPFFKGNDLQGFLVTHFDFRSLITYSPEPEKLMVLSEKEVLWPGTGFDQKGLMGLAWEQILQDKVQGSLEFDSEEYYWISRYVGGLRLVYVVRKG